jgi:Dickkopf N-terminal cysteine-rich region
VRIRLVVAVAIAQAVMACAGQNISFSTGTGGPRPPGADIRQPCQSDSECSQAEYACQLNTCVPRQQARTDCSVDADCGRGKACVSGRCSVPARTEVDL